MHSFPRHSPGHGSSGVRWHPSCGCADTCVESVTVSSPEAEANAVHASKFGNYTKLANVTQAGRPVYQLAGSTVAYLFYWPSTSRWLIGSSYSSGSASVQSTSSPGTACPDQVTGWQAYTGSMRVGTYPITVVPTSPTTAPPTNVGELSHYVRLGVPRHALIQCQCRMIARVARVACLHVPGRSDAAHSPMWQDARQGLKRCLCSR